MIFFKKMLSPVFKTVDVVVIIISFITMVVCTSVSVVNLVKKLKG